MSSDSTQRKLKAFLKRRHPEYESTLPHWKFLKECYEGGREWFSANIFRYMKEGEKEYDDRVERAYRFNHTREVVDLVDKHLFKQHIARSDDAPECLQEFWKNSTLNKLPITEFMKVVSKNGSIYGRPWIVVDSNNRNPEASVAEARRSGARCYAYLVTPENVLDLSVDDEGQLNWILIHEQVRDDRDPIESSGKMINRYRLWTREDWTLFTVKGEGRSVTIESDGPYAHDLGEVPVIPGDNVISSEIYTSPALIADVAYMDRAAANYLSNLDAIIQDQTFSQLAMPAQGLLPGDDGHDKLLEMGTRRIFTYDGEGGAAPFYMSPDVKQAELIMGVINKIISEIYHTVGLAGERTKDDNSQGIDNSSGVAKAYDFERVNSLLASKADSLENIEKRIAALVGKWNGEEIDGDFISYPDNFDVRGLYDEFEIAARLSLIEAPDEMRRYQMEMVIDKLFPRLKKELKEKMLKELKDWPPKMEDLLMAGAAPQGPGKGNAVDPVKKEGRNSLANKLVKDGGK